MSFSNSCSNSRLEVWKSASSASSCSHRVLYFSTSSRDERPLCLCSEADSSTAGIFPTWAPVRRAAVKVFARVPVP